MKPFRVVCIKDNNFTSKPSPKKGDIYKVIDIDKSAGSEGWYIIEGYDYRDSSGEQQAYRPSCFREVDDTFGEAVCERIEQQIEYEKVLATK